MKIISRIRVVSGASVNQFMKTKRTVSSSMSDVRNSRQRSLPLTFFTLNVRT